MCGKNCAILNLPGSLTGGCMFQEFTVNTLLLRISPYLTMGLSIV